ncbi:MAG TPA: 2-amino-4-hydroxy-6-hydroxymethyldihydropteridine diphosphokinase [Phototrophicaceae bacterium]|nr:2-amino-4-hydroxy-6-hydroxymethyldihydropteridine diphosphokinase [Phototrophicaceae bacterium]
MTSPEVYVSLGSNIEPEKYLAAAVRYLREKCEVLAVSSVYRTAPQGYVAQPDFLNMAVCLQTTLQPDTFKARILDWIERELGRVRDPNNKNAPRTIDLDISLWGDGVFEYGTKPWRVPDPDILRFAHVILPLAELAPDFVHPVAGVRLAEIAARFENRFEVFRLED